MHVCDLNLYTVIGVDPMLSGVSLRVFQNLEFADKASLADPLALETLFLLSKHLHY